MCPRLFGSVPAPASPRRVPCSRLVPSRGGVSVRKGQSCCLKLRTHAQSDGTGTAHAHQKMYRGDLSKLRNVAPYCAQASLDGVRTKTCSKEKRFPVRADPPGAAASRRGDTAGRHGGAVVVKVRISRSFTKLLLFICHLVSGDFCQSDT